MKRSIIGKSLLLLPIIFFLLGFYSVRADGMLVPPPEEMIHETDQKAVIFYDKGIENLIISISFQGNAQDFAWIVPTPQKPEVEKSVDSLFTRLDEITKPEPLPMDVSLNSKGMGRYSAPEDAGVTIIETKKIEYYDITVLEANDKDALYNWLNDNGYRFPQAGKYIVDEYIKNNWYFTAVKIDQAQKNNPFAGQQLGGGHAIPLKLSFKTEKVVYPLKITSISQLEDNAPTGEVTYIEGVRGKALQLDQGRILATDRLIKNIDLNQGQLSFYLKKRNSQPLYDIVTLERQEDLTTRNNPERDLRKEEVIKISNQTENIYTFEIGNESKREIFQIDLGSDFKQNEWQEFTFSWNLNNPNSLTVGFSLDGIPRTPELIANPFSGSSELNRFTLKEPAKVSIGGIFLENPFESREISSEDYPNNPGSYITNRVSDILIDELKITSNQSGTSVQVLNADFRENLKAILADNQEISFRLFTSGDRSWDNWPNPLSSMGILLYIFNDGKYEIPGFDVQYAGWFTKDEIKKIATIDGAKPWIEPQANKYFLTRLYRNMEVAEMTEDLYPIESADQKPFNAPLSTEGKMLGIYFLIGISLLLSLGGVFFVIKYGRKKTTEN